MGAVWMIIVSSAVLAFSLLIFSTNAYKGRPAHSGMVGGVIFLGWVFAIIACMFLSFGFYTAGENAGRGHARDASEIDPGKIYTVGASMGDYGADFGTFVALRSFRPFGEEEGYVWYKFKHLDARQLPANGLVVVEKGLDKDGVPYLTLAPSDLSLFGHR